MSENSAELLRTKSQEVACVFTGSPVDQAGEYRVAAVDYWNRRGPYSNVLLVEHSIWKDFTLLETWRKGAR